MTNKTCEECQMFGKKGTVLCDKLEASYPACASFNPKPTNGDKIRQMSNAELAKFMLSVEDEICENYCVRPCMFCSDRCEQAVLAWLNAPAEGEVEDE